MSDIGMNDAVFANAAPRRDRKPQRARLGKMLAGVTLDAIDFPTAKEATSASAGQLASLGWACTVVLIVLGALSLGAFAAYRSPKVPTGE